MLDNFRCFLLSQEKIKRTLGGLIMQKAAWKNLNALFICLKPNDFDNLTVEVNGSINEGVIISTYACLRSVSRRWPPNSSRTSA